MINFVLVKSVFLGVIVFISACSNTESLSAPQPTVTKTITAAPEPPIETVSYEIYIPSERQLREALKQPYINYVGRFPTEDEFNKYVLAVEVEANNNPTEVRISASGRTILYVGFSERDLDSFTLDYVLATPEAQSWATQQGTDDAISDVFSRIEEKARKDLESVVSPGDFCNKEQDPIFCGN